MLKLIIKIIIFLLHIGVAMIIINALQDVMSVDINPFLFLGSGLIVSGICISLLWHVAIFITFIKNQFKK
jgi:hypothetical protein